MCLRGEPRISPSESYPPANVPNIHWVAAQFGPASYTSLALQDKDEIHTITLPPDLKAAVPKRQAEFLAGRFCAATALLKAGKDPKIGRQGRLPLWPQGVVGSISHTNGYAIAAVSTQYRALGIDIEHIMTNAQAHETQTYIMSPKELRQKPAHMDDESFSTLIFSAKEALFKATHSTKTTFADFLDSEVLEVATQTLSLSFEGDIYECHWDRLHKLIRTLVCVSPTPVQQI